MPRRARLQPRPDRGERVPRLPCLRGPGGPGVRRGRSWCAGPRKTVPPQRAAGPPSPSPSRSPSTHEPGPRGRRCGSRSPSAPTCCSWSGSLSGASIRAATFGLCRADPAEPPRAHRRAARHLVPRHHRGGGVRCLARSRQRRAPSGYLIPALLLSLVLWRAGWLQAAVQALSPSAIPWLQTLRVGGRPHPVRRVGVGSRAVGLGGDGGDRRHPGGARRGGRGRPARRPVSRGHALRRRSGTCSGWWTWRTRWSADCSRRPVRSNASSRPRPTSSRRCFRSSTCRRSSFPLTILLHILSLQQLARVGRAQSQGTPESTGTGP